MIRGNGPGGELLEQERYLTYALDRTLGALGLGLGIVFLAAFLTSSAALSLSAGAALLASALVLGASLVGGYVLLTRVRVRVLDRGIIKPWKRGFRENFLEVKDIAAIDFLTSPSSEIQWICRIESADGKAFEITGRQFRNPQTAKSLLMYLRSHLEGASSDVG